MSYELTMAATRKSPRTQQPPQPLQIFSLSLTPDDGAVLTSVAQEASDQIGRRISTSAVLRAILHLMGKDLLPVSAIVETIEREVEGGRIWGSTTEQQRTRTQPRATSGAVTGRTRKTAKT